MQERGFRKNQHSAPYKLILKSTNIAKLYTKTPCITNDSFLVFMKTTAKYFKVKRHRRARRIWFPLYVFPDRGFKLRRLPQWPVSLARFYSVAAVF